MAGRVLVEIGDRTEVAVTSLVLPSSRHKQRRDHERQGRVVSVSDGITLIAPDGTTTTTPPLVKPGDWVTYVRFDGVRAAKALEKAYSETRGKHPAAHDAAQREAEAPYTGWDVTINGKLYIVLPEANIRAVVEGK